MKIKFNSDDNLPLNKILELHNLTVIVRSILQEDSNYYPQVFQMNVCMNYKMLEYDRIDILEEINIKKSKKSK